MIRLLYNLLFPLGFLIFLPGYVRKMRRRGNYRRNAGQRFGIYGAELRRRVAADPHTWIHAVSVGEVAIALKLAAKLRAIDPQFRALLTTTTTTGFAFAEREAPEWLAVSYNPLDFWIVTRRAFTAFRPSRIVLVEAEVWPNLVAEAHHRGIAIALVNARLSERSERRFRKVRALVAPTFGRLDLVCVQEAPDVARWHALGVGPEAIKHVGSIKYDPDEVQVDPAVPRQVLNAIGVAETRPVLLAGSTHAGEEEILARAFLQLRDAVPDALLIIAPRHVERAPQILATLEQLGLRVVRRSLGAGDQHGSVDTVLLDTTGELRHWYAVATAVFIGKSLTTKGGQNPVEPILAGRPVVFGPHMENFASLARSLVERAAAIQIQDAGELVSAMAELLRNAERRAVLVQNAREVLAAHRGATQRTAELLLSLRPSAVPGR
ncbi:MAG TPA: 3-deoxy-D-manno-octulosonic acid transferase [Chthoniobacterales bacterium]